MLDIVGIEPDKKSPYDHRPEQILISKHSDLPQIHLSIESFVRRLFSIHKI